VLETESIVFRSRADGWFAAMAIAAIAGSVWAMIEVHRAGEPVNWVPMLLFFALLAALLWVSLPIRYVITDRDLIVQAGRTRSFIPLDRIEAVRPAPRPLAAAVWPIERLRIDYRGAASGYTLVSPEDPDVFLRALEERSALTRSDAGLVRESW
jgi:hypothetical protein